MIKRTWASHTIPRAHHFIKHFRLGTRYWGTFPTVLDSSLKHGDMCASGIGKLSVGIFYLRLSAFLLFFLENPVPSFPFLTLLLIPPAAAKRSPLRFFSIITLVRKLTTLLKSPGFIFPRTFATFKAFLVIPARSAMSFKVYRYSFLGLYGCLDPFPGILTPYRSSSIEEGFQKQDRLSIILLRISKRKFHHCSRIGKGRVSG
jgi:hypothetical protein